MNSGIEYEVHVSSQPSPSVFTCRLAWCSSSPLSSSQHCSGPLQKQNISVMELKRQCVKLRLNLIKWVMVFFKLTHANVIFAAITPDVVGHLKP